MYSLRENYAFRGDTLSVADASDFRVVAYLELFALAP